MKILLTSRRGTIELVLDTNIITVNEEIPYISQEGIKVMMNLRIYITKLICQFFVFLVNQDNPYGLNQTKKIVKLFC